MILKWIHAAVIVSMALYAVAVAISAYAISSELAQSQPGAETLTQGELEMASLLAVVVVVALVAIGGVKICDLLWRKGVYLVTVAYALAETDDSLKNASLQRCLDAVPPLETFSLVDLMLGTVAVTLISLAICTAMHWEALLMVQTTILALVFRWVPGVTLGVLLTITSMVSWLVRKFLTFVKN